MSERIIPKSTNNVACSKILETLEYQLSRKKERMYSKAEKSLCIQMTGQAHMEEVRRLQSTEQDSGSLSSEKVTRYYYVERISSKAKGTAYNGSVRPATLYGSEMWCLGENKMAMLKGSR